MEKAQSSSDGTASNLEQLEKLADLKEEGVISEEEFQEKKRDVLDSI